jgi:type II pantothenate kinase
MAPESETYQADGPKGLPIGSGNARPGTDGTAPTITGTSPTGRPRTATTTAEIDTTLTHPGSVRINVKGAFIVDQDSKESTNTSPRNGRGSPERHETKDIRLPNHTAVVSHIAIDVRHAPATIMLPRALC